MATDLSTATALFEQFKVIIGVHLPQLGLPDHASHMIVPTMQAAVAKDDAAASKRLLSALKVRAGRDRRGSGAGAVLLTMPFVAR